MLIEHLIILITC